MVLPLVIAQGTPWDVTAFDARRYQRWAQDGGPRADGPPPAIIIHHTATPAEGGTASQQLAHLTRIEAAGPFGLPYNFVIYPGARRRIWYLNDVDRRWPHTLGLNHGCAVAVVGNYSEVVVSPQIVHRVVRLCRALRSMWGADLPVIPHRWLQATECPGTSLYDALDARQFFDRLK